ncbi:hypothetical protein N824_17425 [Pedobacter sp. V48]|nr:hypothetical protein N824_17425 [Pedobacter sp. V48]
MQLFQKFGLMIKSESKGGIVVILSLSQDLAITIQNLPKI